MAEKHYDLYVCIPARDRLVMTQKCIESIHENSTLFRSINIYVYDNCSKAISERLSVFSNLLETGTIKYYSYDTVESTNSCFPKPVVFRRWIDMMIEKHEIKQRTTPEDNIKSMYLMTDNDMIYGPKWDTYFVSLLDVIKDVAPETKFICKSPGEKYERERAEHFTKYTNTYTGEEVLLGMTCGGGTGCCWVMDYDMLKCLRWNNDEIASVFHMHKQADGYTWYKLRREYPGTDYLTSIVPPDYQNEPLVINLGPEIGSVCNGLTYSDYNDKMIKGNSDRERKFKNMSISEIYNNYKHRGLW